ncbi:FecR domain-containing protein [Acidovorax sp. CCYZU-2555]|uniref:FecR domain-containing protein n=1 Tax=Acidovorax sp. CCYZU-2555 TaxID=2835042 RepID=UPI001BD19D53|nr:FecR domain-containing protein [Acidovorax sp. CCYZU-2555]MBS7779880.1 FecR domain-containing protein [Acidovorax sp. CCYZU-2555]
MNATPIPEHTAREAAEWLATLMSGTAGEDDTRRWRLWREADPINERAWRRIEHLSAGLRQLHPGAARQALAPPHAGRRRALRTLLWAGAAGTVGWTSLRSPKGRELLADERTATGERREVMLPDGTRVLLDTASAVDVRFDSAERLLLLRAGQILVTSGHPHGESRPLIVQSAQGRARALGTRFSVRQEEGATTVAVTEGAVEFAGRGGVSRVLAAGEWARLGPAGFDAQPRALDEETALAWTRGQILADGMRLDAFLAELGRYRPGLLQCDPAVGALRISGVFPVADTDTVLATLPLSLPVQVRTRTRWWLRVEPAGTSL